MGYRLAWLAGAGAVGLALLRLERLITPAETGLPWPVALAAAALLGGLITWIALGYRVGRAGIIGANLLFFSLAAVRIGSPQDAWGGVFPTWTTFENLREELSVALDVIRFGAPPVPPLAGLLVILAAVLWALGALLAWGLSSGRPALALVPPLLFYLQLATIDRTDPGIAWVVSALVFVAASFLAVVFDERRAGGRLRLATNAAQLPPTASSLPIAFIGIPAVLALLAMGAMADRIDEAGLIGWRQGSLGGGGIAAGVSYNLFADSIQQGLVADSDRVVFRAQVSGDVDPASLFFRLVTLNRYDGRHWVAATSPRRPPPEGEAWSNPQHVQAGETVEVVQDVEIAALAMNVLPALAQPQTLETPVGIISQSYRVAEDGSIWLQARTRPGNSYRVTSEVAVVDVGSLASIGRSLSPIFAQAREDGATDVQPRSSDPVPRPDDIDTFLELPADLSRALRDEAVRITEDATTSYERALMLEGFFLRRGGFTYTTATEGHGARDLLEWLFDPLSDNYRAGYCEQFATAMGVMARTIGIPSRVVLGFIPGDVIGNEVIVRQKYAHAWVELWIDGHGWVRFDPTPRADGLNARGTMASLVGFDPAEHIPPPEEEPTGGERSETTNPTIPRGLLITPFDPIPPIILPGTDVEIPFWVAVMLALGVLASIVPSIKWMRRRRRLERLRHGDIAAAWLEITDRLIDLGSPVPSHQTPIELALSTHSSLGPLAAEYGRVVYGPGGPTPPQSITTAERSLASLESHLRGELPWSRRAWAWVRPGSLLRR